ncbi:AMP-dependent synthetase [Alteribacter lacisalsi]|uniref:acetate--CoA ligase n=1 Tax=Alteribacter lacisalsi TaxID=2045244 RepID=A0A2W0HF91_9BACI|nr:AMP-binding protein [Alteribacter lacisalsi]PYZ95985.1 AMP-dependent synthetase [Alteribacter lacisalsi]
MNLTTQKKYAWHPSEEQIQSANLTAFLRKTGLQNVQQLHQWSIEEPLSFYSFVLEELNLSWYAPFTQVMDSSEGKANTAFFTEGKTNVLLNTVEKQLRLGRGGEEAIVWESEEGDVVSLTYRELEKKIDEFAAALLSLGIQKGDRVGIYLPYIPEVPIAFYACAKIGAVSIPIFSGYGEEAVAVRLQEGQAKVLITADGFKRRGKLIPLKQTADRAVLNAPSVKDVIVIEHTGQDIHLNLESDHLYRDLRQCNAIVETEVMDADDPLMIIYTSGTTGKPKGTVHTHVSYVTKSSLDMYFCFDVKKEDRLFWLTDFGWMMGPWLVLGSGLHGNTLVMFEGSPDYPECNRLFELIERHRISIFGVAPTVIRSLKAQIEKITEDLSTIRILGSTGEAWDEESWHWYLHHVGKNRAPIINYSGGTEVSGGILGCFPTLPIKPCGFHGPIPGMSAKVLDEKGKETDELGELSLTEPFIGMTQSLWHDHDRYLKTYWSRFPGVWSHGDLARKDEDGFWFLEGRSDDTMKIAGKGIGPGEIEAAIGSHPNVVESAAVGIPHPIKGQTAVIFAVLTDADLPVKELEAHCTERLGKALKPERIIPVPELPLTQSGKIARRLIRNRYLNKPLGDTSTLRNPESLKTIIPLKH